VTAWKAQAPMEMLQMLKKNLKFKASEMAGNSSKV
jgi:hypothetical protein